MNFLDKDGLNHFWTTYISPIFLTKGKLYPVGAVIYSVSSISLTTLGNDFGGTWKEIPGFLRGVNEPTIKSAYTAADGGHYQANVHSHSIPAHSHTSNHAHASTTTNAPGHTHKVRNNQRFKSGSAKRWNLRFGESYTGMTAAGNHSHTVTVSNATPSNPVGGANTTTTGITGLKPKTNKGSELDANYSNIPPSIGVYCYVKIS